MKITPSRSRSSSDAESHQLFLDQSLTYLQNLMTTLSVSLSNAAFHIWVKLRLKNKDKIRWRGGERSIHSLLPWLSSSVKSLMLTHTHTHTRPVRTKWSVAMCEMSRWQPTFLEVECVTAERMGWKRRKAITVKPFVQHLPNCSPTHL